MAHAVSDRCLFCAIVNGREGASIVFEDELTVAFVDVRQFHPGHTLIVPRQHIADIRELDAGDRRPVEPQRSTLDSHAERLRQHL